VHNRKKKICITALLFAWLLLPVKSHFTVTTSYILLYIIAYQRDTHLYFIISPSRN